MRKRMGTILFFMIKYVLTGGGTNMSLYIYKNTNKLILVLPPAEAHINLNKIS